MERFVSHWKQSYGWYMGVFDLKITNRRSPEMRPEGGQETEDKYFSRVCSHIIKLIDLSAFLKAPRYFHLFGVCKYPLLLKRASTLK